MWSHRTDFEQQPNRLARLLAAARDAGETLLDLTESNPTRVGLTASPALWQSLADPRAASYEPHPLGQPAARRAVADYLRGRGQPAEPGDIVLTASSSESYGWLFRMLCDPGDQVLVPQPSYPLLPILAQLEGVELSPYPLLRDEAWRVDVSAVERALGRGRTGAIVLVHPNNPTGSMVRRDDAERLGRLAGEAGAALIVDEVFIDHLHGPLRPDRLPTFVGFDRALCFVLGGLSKLALLPQLKLGWIACQGPATPRRQAVARLEWIADSYLSVSTPVQLALPAILATVGSLGRSVRARLQQNLAAIDAAIAAVGPRCPVRRVPSEGGWYAMIDVPRTRSDDDWLQLLVEQERLIVHPGYFFDCAEAGTMVVSLLLDPEVFAPAIARAVARWSQG